MKYARWRFGTALKEFGERHNMVSLIRIGYLIRS